MMLIWQTWTERGREGGGYLRQVEETARYLRQSRGGASDIGKQGECTEKIVMMT